VVFDADSIEEAHAAGWRNMGKGVQHWREKTIEHWETIIHL
jgi:hypothetical protein